jgi:transposase
MNAKLGYLHLHVPFIRCEKMAVTDMFSQRSVIEFLVKDGNSTGIIYERLRGVYGDVCIGASSVRRWVKHFKDGNTDIANQPRCDQRTAATERNKQKVDELIRQDRRITVREIAEQLGVGHCAVRRKPSSFNMTSRDLTEVHRSGWRFCRKVIKDA